MSKKVKIILIGFLLLIIIILVSLLVFLPKKTITPEEQAPNLVREVGQRIINKILPSIRKQTPAPEETEETEKTSSCFILDEEFCTQGEFVYNIYGYLVGLGFRLPKGTKVYTPFKGMMESDDEKVEIEYGVYRASVLLDTSKDDWARQETRTIFTALGYHKREEENKKQFNKGDVFVLVGDSPVDPKLGDYNLILNFRVFYNRTGQWYTDINLLREFFK